jgi:hypothetical protein
MNWKRLESKRLCLFRSTGWHSNVSTWIQDSQTPVSKHSLWSLNRINSNLFFPSSAVANCADISQVHSVTVRCIMRTRFSVSVRHLLYAMHNRTSPSSCCDLATRFSTSDYGLTVAVRSLL